MRYRVLPYRQGSKSAKALAEALGGKVLKLEGSKFKKRVGDVIINWGNSSLQTGIGLVQPAHVSFNGDPFWLKHASNKLLFFNHMKEVNSNLTPDFWTNRQEIPEDAYPIVCRTILAGHSGQGIVIADGPDSLVDAPLYVKYEKKKDEYRVHVGRDHSCILAQDDTYSIIAVQRKARRNGYDNPNWQVRNLAGGFVYVRNEVNPPAGVLGAATAALEASGLDFGAVDVIWNAQQEKAYVLEINTAPGLEGQTVSDYANFFTQSG